MTHLRPLTSIALASLLALVACGDDTQKNANNGQANNGNNGQTNNNNGQTNNGQTNNGQTNNGDACAAVVCDQLPADFCDGAFAVSYSGTGSCDSNDGSCDYGTAESRVDCAANGETCANGACVAGNPCDAVTCDMPPADSCMGTVAVVYDGSNGTCDMTNGSCDYAATATMTDCATSGQMCSNGACVDDLCANVDCTQPPAAMCNGNVAVSFTAAGVCDSSTGLCDFSAGENPTDCAASGQICAAGACVADNDPTVTPGSLVITEFMYDSDATSDTDGEWIELYNATNRTLDLQGITIEEGSGNAVTLPTGTPITLAGNSYFVLARDLDPAVNGGVTADAQFDQGLNNSGDFILITGTDGTTEIDRVDYDPSDPAWHETAGQSVQFGGDPATDNNANGFLWCGGTTQLTGGDYGTPGAANDGCTPQSVTIFQLQDPANPPMTETMVSITGAVVTATDGVQFWLADPAGGMYSGLHVHPGNLDVTAMGLKRGDEVELVGRYTERAQRVNGINTNGTTSVVAHTLTITGSAAQPAPVTVETSVLADATTSEPWEGVVVRIVEAGVTNEDIGNNDFRVDGQLIIDDVIDGTAFQSALNCGIFEELTGVMHYTFSQPRLEPRDAADLGTITQLTDAAADVDIFAQNIAWVDADQCTQTTFTASWANLDNVPHTATSRLPTISDPTMNIPASPAFDLSLDASGGANDVQTFTLQTAGTYHYRCRPHPNMTGRIVVLEP